MKTLVEHLSQYAAYHRDTRNILSHFVGIPLIVIAVATLLSRPQWAAISPALVLMVASAVFYLRLKIIQGTVHVAKPINKKPTKTVGSKYPSRITGGC